MPDQTSKVDKDRPLRPHRYSRIQLSRRLFLLSLVIFLMLSVAGVVVFLNQSSTHVQSPSAKLAATIHTPPPTATQAVPTQGSSATTPQSSSTQAPTSTTAQVPPVPGQAPTPTQVPSTRAPAPTATPTPPTPTPRPLCSTLSTWPSTKSYINIWTTATGRNGTDNTCTQIGQSNTSTNPQYVWCRRWGGEVKDSNGNFNHWWLWTDLDTSGHGWISAYYIQGQGNDQADDMYTGKPIPAC
jgi:hypothetical protein